MAEKAKQVDPKHEEAIASAVKGDLKPLREGYLIIRDEQENFVPFIYNSIQAHYDTQRGRRNITVKPRKIGFTTKWIAMSYLKAWTQEGYQALAFTYDDEEAQYMGSILRRFHDMLPKGAQPKLGTDTLTAMSFPRMDSAIEIQSSGGKRKARGRTPSDILLDEFGQYDETVAAGIWSSVVNSAPLWTNIDVQSTPTGIGTEFHRQFVRAENGESPFKAHFYPWMWLPQKHRIAIDSPFTENMPQLRRLLEFTLEEQTLLETWNSQHPDLLLDEDNIRWRRYKAAEDPDKFAQEFPENSIACFLATTDTVFETVALSPWLQRARAPIETDRNGTLKIWKRPQPGQAYCVGVDCGEGIQGRDNSVAVVGTTYGEVVLVLAGIYDQMEMAQLVYELAGKYNEAFVVNERQAGFTFQLTLHNMGYKSLYRHQENADRPRIGVQRTLPALGFPTTQTSKMLLINTMRAALKSDGFQCPDVQTLRELVEFKRHKDGTYGAPVGVDSHDDRAMAAMLYLYALSVSERSTPQTKRRLDVQGQRTSAVPAGVFE